MRVARFLKAHPKVAWVSYTGLPDHPSHELARKYLRGGFGSVFTFGVQGRRRGRPPGDRRGPADFASGERRGRQDSHPPSGVDLPFPAVRGRAAGGRASRPTSCGCPWASSTRTTSSPTSTGRWRAPDKETWPDERIQRPSRQGGASVGVVEKKFFSFGGPPGELILESGQRLGPSRSPTKPMASWTRRRATRSSSSTPFPGTRTRPAFIPTGTRSPAGGTTWWVRERDRHRQVLRRSARTSSAAATGRPGRVRSTPRQGGLTGWAFP